MGSEARFVRFRATVEDAEDGVLLLTGAAFESGVYLIACQEVGSECAGAIRHSPVVVQGRARTRMRTDPSFGGGAGSRWIVEDCRCELSRGAWVPPTQKQMADIVRYARERDTLSASNGSNLPLSVIAQILEGDSPDQLDPFAADPQRTRQPLWEWRKYWVVEVTDDYERNRFVSHE